MNFAELRRVNELKRALGVPVIIDTNFDHVRERLGLPADEPESNWHRHSNPDGSWGGWVQNLSYVAEDAFVSFDSLVWGKGTVVGPGVLVSGEGTLIGGGARIFGRGTEVRGGARINQPVTITSGIISDDRYYTPPVVAQEPGIRVVGPFETHYQKSASRGC